MTKARCRFYLGTHEVSWLTRTNMPLFVSHRRLARQKSLPTPVAPWEAAPWALDSGGFSELSLFGGWRTTPATYAAAAARYQAVIGNMAWAAIQDWMCEPFMLERTGLTVAEHQARTIQSYLELRELAPSVPWAPVLQGYELADYHRHVAAYAAAGIDLDAAPVVGVGSVCRRQGTDEVAEVIGSLAALGLRLHGFGIKTLGLARVAHLLASADSMAWSLDARRPNRTHDVEGCTHATCANCLYYAATWRASVLTTAGLHRAVAA